MAENGCAEPADRSFRGIFFGLYPAAESGGFGGGPAENQPEAESDTRIPGCKTVDSAQIPFPVEGLRRADAVFHGGFPAAFAVLRGDSGDFFRFRESDCDFAPVSVDYKQDNWLRNWFASIDPDSLDITVESSPSGWQRIMERVFRELYRVLCPGGYLAFEVGEIRRGKLRMEDLALPAGVSAGLKPVLILINAQQFTKTSNCWGVENHTKGTNTNRIVLFRKD